MKKIIYLIGFFILFLTFGSKSIVWPQSEPVNGYYDPVKDWFVFDWDRPNYGRVTTIYDPPNKVNPIIKAKLVPDAKNQNFIYSYEVTNQVGSKQLLYDIVVKYLSPIHDAKSPSPADDWHMAQYRGKDAWHWAKTGGENRGIVGGQTEKGFSFSSKGLPTIVNAGFLGYKRAIYSPPGDYDTDEVEDSFSKVFKSLEERYKEKFEYVMRKTLGPTEPPADFKAAAFLDSIINMKHEAASLGWIKNEGIVNSLDVKLDNAKKKIAEGSPGAAKNILNAFINEVEAQGCATYENCPPGKHLTTEAYALLKYNAQYLIDNLAK